MIANRHNYERYTAWCGILRIRPLSFTSWRKHATEILMTLSRSGDAAYAQDAAGFWLGRIDSQPGREVGTSA